MTLEQLIVVTQLLDTHQIQLLDCNSQSWGIPVGWIAGYVIDTTICFDIDPIGNSYWYTNSVAANKFEGSWSVYPWKPGKGWIGTKWSTARDEVDATRSNVDNPNYNEWLAETNGKHPRE